MNKAFSLILVFACSCASVPKQKEIEHTFTNKTEVTITASPMSQYRIVPSRDQNIHIQITNPDHPTVRYTINETNQALFLGEKDLDYHPNKPTPKDIFKWRVELPEKTKLVCNGGIAKMAVDSFHGSLSVSAGIATIKITRSKGQFQIYSGMGSIHLNQCEGSFKISGGQSVVDALQLDIQGESTFSVNGGPLYVSLSKTPTNNITLMTGTGAGILNYNGNPIIGNFKFSGEKGKGRIFSPYRFDTEEIYKDDLKQIQNQNDFGKKVDYLLKKQVIGSPSPEIQFKTSQGRLVLRQ